MNDRIFAAELYVNAIRTGEVAAAQYASRYLAKDVVGIAGKDEFKGYDAVLDRINGIWPAIAVYHHGAWSAPREEGGNVVVGASFSGFGAAPSGIKLVFSYNAENKINKIVTEVLPREAPVATDKISDVVAGLVNGALFNRTPMTLAYTDENGVPQLSLRGSTHVYSDHQLSIWLRTATGGITRAIAKHPTIALMYRDNITRTTLNFQGKAHVETDEAVRTRVYELSPEVEQRHDIHRKGAVLIIDVEKIVGGTPRGPVKMERKG